MGILKRWDNALQEWVPHSGIYGSVSHEDLALAIAGITPSGREIAYAETTVQQSTTSSTQLGITGLEITFEVGVRPIMVEGYVSWITCTATCTAGLAIRDESNVDKRYSGIGVISNHFSSGIIRERISDPGSYTRRLSFARSSGSGTLTNNLNVPTVVSSIRAVEL